MTDWRGHGGSWDGDGPVYDVYLEFLIEEYCEEVGVELMEYPCVWILEQREAPTDHSTGRYYEAFYTAEGDPDGDDALDYGSAYYSEGMSCDGDTEHQKRVMCFQAAELLYLHAASKGNPDAHLCLGYVYSYDRCEGDYYEREAYAEAEAEMLRRIRKYGPYCDWVSPTRQRLSHTFPHLERAVEHFRVAAEAGIAEACYKLGDMLRDGSGCEVDLDEAYRWFVQAYELAVHEGPLVRGSAALRLGRAREEGEGCEQSFHEARRWYERACDDLGIAVGSGEDWYRKSLTRAERGLRRVRQELSGKY